MSRAYVKLIALKMVKESGLINLSRRALCERANIPDGSFPHVMGCTFSDFLKELKMETPRTGVHPVSKSRVDPGLRRDQILTAAVHTARDEGYRRMTRDSIAKRAGVSESLISRYFNTMKQLRRDVMRAAIVQEVPEIIAQGLANGDKHAKKAPLALKEKAVALLSNL